MKYMNIPKARKNLYRIVEEIAQFSEPVKISSKNRDVVMIFTEDFRD